MDRVIVAWKKQLPNQDQFLSNKQILQQESTEKINNDRANTTVKQVRFNCPTSAAEKQAFENTDENDVKTNQSKKIISDDDNYMFSSATNIFTDELTTTHHKPICSVRATVITFIIVVSVILVAGISIGVVFGTARTSQNTNASKSTYSTISARMVTSNVIIGSQNGPPCSSYTTIDDPTRNIAYPGGSKCDNGKIFNTSNGGAWIRFVGSGGTIIPLSPPMQRRCDSFATAWFNGSLPTVIGTIINGTIWISLFQPPLMFYRSIAVIYCSGGYYVYFLRPFDFCSARYCTV